MSRIAARFSQLKKEGEGALVAFMVAGDPDRAASDQVLQALAEGGADVVELGAPFSDPLADGVVIQEASQRALRHKFSMADVLEMIRRFRRGWETPLLVMTCYNLILQYGLARFAREAKAAGLDAVLVTDLPPEEANAWTAEARRQGLDMIYLLAPTSDEERIIRITSQCSGFVYCVSRMGVTGARQDLPPELADFLGKVKAHTPLPVAVEFGVSNQEQVRQVCRFADGAVVGSAIVRVIAENASHPELRVRVRDFVKELKAGTRPVNKR